MRDMWFQLLVPTRAVYNARASDPPPSQGGAGGGCRDSESLTECLVDDTVRALDSNLYAADSTFPQPLPVREGGSTMAKLPRCRAFTFLEMLSATALMGVLTVAVMSSLHIGFKARATAQRRVDPVQQLALAMELIQNDLCASLPVTGDLVAECIGEDDQDRGGSDNDVLVLFNSKPYTPWPDHPVGLRRVEFMVDQTSQDEPPALIRQVIDNTLAPIEPEPMVELLCRNVRGFNLRYYDGSTWVDTWDSAGDDGGLPEAVEVTIELQDEDAEESSGPRLVTIVSVPCGGATISGEGGRIVR